MTSSLSSISQGASAAGGAPGATCFARRFLSSSCRSDDTPRLSSTMYSESFDSTLDAFDSFFPLAALLLLLALSLFFELLDRCFEAPLEAFLSDFWLLPLPSSLDEDLFAAVRLAAAAVSDRPPFLAALSCW